MWYAKPPFRVNHRARHTMELEWDDEYSGDGFKLLTVNMTYLPDGNYLIEVVL